MSHSPLAPRQRGRRTKANKRDALQALKDAKAGKRRGLDQIDIDEDDMFEEVDEDTYQQRKAQMRREGFCEDSDEWSEEENQRKKKRKSKGKKQQQPETKASNRIESAFVRASGINSRRVGPRFSKGLLSKPPASKKQRKPQAPKDDFDADMDFEAVLAELDEDVQDDMEFSNPVPSPPDKIRHRPTSDCMDSHLRDDTPPRVQIKRKRPVRRELNLDEEAPAAKKERHDAEESKYNVVVPRAADTEAVGVPDVMEPEPLPDADEGPPTPELPTEETAPNEATPKLQALPPQMAPTKFEHGGQDWFALQREQSESSAPQTSSSLSRSSSDATSPLQDDNTLQMYWYDAYEVPYVQSSNVYLFGKAKVPNSEETVSCCVTVQNVERNVFLLPRDVVWDDPDNPNSKTDQPVEIMDVYSEFKDMAHDLGIKQWLSKPVNRNYAFEAKQDGIPNETQYLKVVYRGDYPQLDRNLKGRTFSHVLGTHSSLLELFLMKRDLMGPCWVTIKDAVPVPASKSWCKYEFTINSQKHVQVTPEVEAPPAPTFKVLSLSMKTTLKNHSHEIVMASLLINDHVNVTGTTEAQTKITNITAMRSVKGHEWPLNLQQSIPKSQKRKLIMLPNERAILTWLVAQINRNDPDVVVGHGLHGHTADVLLHRLQHHKIHHWSKLGRLRKTKMPRVSGHGFSAIDQGLGSGRLYCDTSVSAKELVRENNYSLTHMAKTHLKINREDIEVANVPQFYNTAQSLLHLVKHNENDAYLALALMFKLEVLPLTRQLTCLAGNLWARSLRSARAERIEYLLLHEFYRLKYINPEKYTGKERKIRKEKAKAAAKKAKKAAAKQAKAKAAGMMDIDDDEEEEEVNSTSKSTSARRKPAYAGGLVLEPIKGLYDQFIVMLDFNSLYPSIIREFNICFTTVKHWEVGDDIGQVPDVGQEQGVLPKVMKRLLERRRAVKKLLKNEKNPAKQKQLDIRQKALKLVANSMYGCLGFPSSRFYCKPLASLVTSQGRDTLQRTKELAESMGFMVVYGDTDSIMINTNTTNLEQALQVGNELKKAVNKNYKVLEIEIDGVYQRMLLLRKKKYAALMIVPSSDGKYTAKKETKGLDMVRRDWCALSKDAGTYILDKILSGMARDEVVDAIHQHLQTLAAELKDNKIPLEKFIITKGLTKHPKDYPNAKAQPHVNVALQMLAKGKPVRVGDHIPYIVCEGDQPMAERAHHPDAIIEAKGALAIDRQWYLSNQVLPPIARLCDPIQETSAAQIAACLGLDAKKFASLMGPEESKDDEEEFLHSMSFEDDQERFKDCFPLKITCKYCKVSFDFAGVYNPAKEYSSGLSCVVPDCPGVIKDDVADVSRIMNLIDMEARKFIGLYYDGWLVCDEPQCMMRTQQRSVRGLHCMAPGCRGNLHPEFPAKQLYEQLQYFATLFDVERANKLLASENHRRAQSKKNEPQIFTTISASHKKAFANLHDHVTMFIKESNYHYIPPSVFHTSHKLK